MKIDLFTRLPADRRVAGLIYLAEDARTAIVAVPWIPGVAGRARKARGSADDQEIRRAVEDELLRYRDFLLYEGVLDELAF